MEYRLIMIVVLQKLHETQGCSLYSMNYIYIYISYNYIIALSEILSTLHIDETHKMIY